jgi:regulator of nonsense transcripts 2
VLPHYARLAATMALCFKHIDTELCSLLKEEFDELSERSKPNEVELRVNNARYLGELLKFKLLQPAVLFACLKSCLDNFSPANAFVACALLETCGRYLHRNKETQPRVEAMLEVIVKLRSIHRLPPDLDTQLDNAVASCKPPERSAVVAEVLAPMHQYVRWLLHRHLNKNTVEVVIRQLRKLPWGQEEAEVEGWVHRAVMEMGAVKYHTIQLVGCVVSGLYRYQEAAMVRIVDGAVEALRCALERNDYRESQARACLARLVGEFYNYRLINSDVIFRVLYWLVPLEAGTWGHVVPMMHVPAHLEQPGYGPKAAPASRGLQHPGEPMGDSPDDLGRLRLVCTLLDTCGQFFDKGSAKRRLDVYLVRLMPYLFCKALTVEMEFGLSDTFGVVRKPSPSLP